MGGLRVESQDQSPKLLLELTLFLRAKSTFPLGSYIVVRLFRGVNAVWILGELEADRQSLQSFSFFFTSFSATTDNSSQPSLPASSITRHPLIMSVSASLEKNLGLFVRIISRQSISALGAKGSTLYKISYNVTPRDQISHLEVCSWQPSTCGDMQNGVPSTSFRTSCLWERCFANPKSMILGTPSLSMILSGLMSLWVMLERYRCFIPWIIPQEIDTTSRFQGLTSVSLESHFSLTIYTLFSVVNILCILRMLGWGVRKELRTSISFWRTLRVMGERVLSAMVLMATGSLVTRQEPRYTIEDVPDPRMREVLQAQESTCLIIEGEILLNLMYDLRICMCFKQEYNRRTEILPKRGQSERRGGWGSRTRVVERERGEQILYQLVPLNLSEWWACNKMNGGV